MNTEFLSRRRLLILTILPTVLLFAVTPLASRFAPQGREPQPQQFASVALPADTELERMHRIAALDVVARLEKEANHQKGTTHLTPLDLKRLRNALR